MTKPNPEPFKRVTVDIEFKAVDPAVLGILTGGAIGTPPPSPTFSIDVLTPIRRRWWEWVLRRPRRYQRTYIPYATLADPASTPGENP